MKPPPNPRFVGAVVELTWRDSFQDNGQTKEKDIGSDCVWKTWGLVVRETPLFISLAFGKAEPNTTDAGDLADVLSVPWSQVVRSPRVLKSKTEE